MFDMNVSSIDCYQENGKNYRGTVRKTRKGITCQKWNVNTPHRTKYDPLVSCVYLNCLFTIADCV